MGVNMARGKTLYGKNPYGKIPYLTDPNMTSDYQKLTAMFDLFEEEESKQEILEQIMSNESLETDIITDFDFSLHFEKTDFLSLLFYWGFLTIRGEGTLYDVVLQTPNYVIRDIYYQYYSNYINNLQKI